MIIKLSTVLLCLWVEILLGSLVIAFSIMDDNSISKSMDSYRPQEDVPNLQTPMIPLGCHEMINVEGYYYFYSKSEMLEACSLSLIGPLDSMIKISFPVFSIDCQTGGAAYVIDGWEMKGEFFPSIKDTNYNPDKVKPLCLPNLGISKDYTFLSSQNVAEVQFRIPGIKEGFVIRVEIVKHPRPCNAVAMSPYGTHTLRNYGLNINCALSIIYPEKISIKRLRIGPPLNLSRLDPSYSSMRNSGDLEFRDTDDDGSDRDVLEAILKQKRQDAAMVRRRQRITSGYKHFKCSKLGMKDYVEFKEGNGLDPSNMHSLIDMCGKDNNPDLEIELKGEHSVVRLVSSGNYDNSISFDFRKLNQLEN